MRAGHPLTDEDRLPWLRSIAAWIDERVATGRPGVVTSSALKRSYRNLLVDGHAEVRIVLLDGDRDTIAARMRARKGHFFSADLLDSQFADLERPEPDENIVTAPITGTPRKRSSTSSRPWTCPRGRTDREDTPPPRTHQSRT